VGRFGAHIPDRQRARNTTATSKAQLGPIRLVGRLPRAALVARLNDALARRLTILTADAGFGKSTLLATWAEDVDCAWHTVSARDAALPSLARSVDVALRTRLPELAETAIAGADGDALLHADAFAGVLCAALADQPGADLVLVLDDVHEIEAAGASARLVESLCRHAPARLHLVLASRADPPFAVDRLRGQGEVLELSASDLAFAVEEIEALLVASLEDPEPGLAPALHELTAGWPALVRLAVDALRTIPAGERAGALDGLHGARAAMFAYLAGEVFEREPADVRQLLRTAALFDVFTPELCEALDVSHATDAIERLARRGRFLERRGDRWSLHELIRGFVLRAWPWDAETASDLYRRAGAWLEVNGQLDEALRALTAGGGERELARLLARHGASMLAAGGAHAVTRYAELLPSEVRDAAIDQLAGEAYTIRGRHDRALECFARAAADSERLAPGLAWRMAQAHFFRDDLDGALAACARGEPSGPGETADDALLLAWSASVLTRRGDVDRARTHAERALRAASAAGDDRALAAAHIAAAGVAPAEGDPLVRDGHLATALEAAQRAGDLLQTVRVRNNKGSAMLEVGRYREAIAELDATIALAEVVGFAALRALALMNRGLANWCLGRLDDASADYEAAIQIYRQIGTREVCYAIIGRGDVHRERGNLAMARAAYEEGLRIAERSGDLQGLVPGLYQLAKVVVDDEPQLALSLAQRAVAYGWPDRSWALNALGWVALADGDRTRAAHAAARAARAARDQRDRYGLAESLELAALCTSDSDARTPLLEEALAIWRELGNDLHAVEVQLALARLASGPAGHGAVERAERKLRALGVRVSASGPAGLLRFVALEPAAAVAIESLGGFRVRRDGRPVRQEEWRSRKARDLLKILLARRGHPTPRELVMEALWPQEDPRKLRNRLSVALSTLRAVLDPDRRFGPDHFVRADRDYLALDLNNVVVDVEILMHEAAAGLKRLGGESRGDAAERLEHAESLYAGDFLEEDPYEDWAIPLREEARSAYLDCAHRLASDAVAAGDHAAATGYLLRVLERDPYDEHAHLELVRALNAARRHGDARRAYRAYVGRMAEVGVEPSAFPSARTKSATAASS
jgi:ATP/maltotriose-dependent transcriptional regulator MalT/DNA-binding SARP family transcriptional activator